MNSSTGLPTPEGSAADPESSGEGPGAAMKLAADDVQTLVINRASKVETHVQRN